MLAQLQTIIKLKGCKKIASVSLSEGFIVKVIQTM